MDDNINNINHKIIAKNKSITAKDVNNIITKSFSNISELIIIPYFVYLENKILTDEQLKELEGLKNQEYYLKLIEITVVQLSNLNMETQKTYWKEFTETDEFKEILNNVDNKNKLAELTNTFMYPVTDENAEGLPGTEFYQPVN